jgi:hypothetical protein
VEGFKEKINSAIFTTVLNTTLEALFTFIIINFASCLKKYQTYQFRGRHYAFLTNLEAILPGIKFTFVENQILGVRCKQFYYFSIGKWGFNVLYREIIVLCKRTNF